jgi:hypothetical protein
VKVVLKYLTDAIVNDPGIHKLKDSFVAPDAGHDFFIHLNHVGIPGEAGLKVDSGPVELSVLCPGAFRVSHGLVDRLGIRSIFSARGIVAFINKVAGLEINLVLIRSPHAYGHEKDRGSVARPVVHASLELNAFLSNNLGVRNDVVGLQ